MGFDELWDGFDKVCKRANEGEGFVGAILRYFTKRHKVELEYAKSMEHLASGMEELEIGSTKELWLSVQRETKTAGDERTKFCDHLVELTTSVANNLKEEKKNRIALVAKGQKLVAELAKTEDTMKKARAKYVDARKQQAKAQMAAEKEKGKAGSTAAKLQKAAEKDEKRADKADNEYRISVNSLKQAQDKFYDQEMPALLREFEEHEKKRLENVRVFIQKFVDIWNPIAPGLKAALDRLQAKVKDIDIAGDLKLYVEQNRPESDQPPPRAQYISHDGSVVQDVSSGSSSAGLARDSGKKPKDKAGGSGFKIGLGGKKGKDDEKKPEKVPEKNEKKLVKQDSTVSKTPLSPKGPNETGTTHISAVVPVEPPPAPPANGKDDSSHSSSEKEQGAGIPEPVPVSSPPKSDKPDSELVELVTIYAYDATEANELTFEEGETIFLIEKDDSGWWRGRNKKGVEGVFPSNFVEVVGEEGGGGASGTTDINADFTALYDYEAEDDTELTIKEGEILHVISETDGWYFGTNAQGQKGNFPSNFVERLEAKS